MTRKTALLLTICASVGGCHSSTDNPDAGPPIEPPFVGPQPFFGQTVSAETPPPAISGGTLTILADGVTAVAADPDRDHVYVVNLTTKTKTADIALAVGDEPGRVIADGAGRVHVVLRGGAALATIDPIAGTVIGRRSVCAVPRGAAWEASTDLVHVACAGGELVSLPAAGGAATRTLHLDRDLRDVIAMDGTLYVSKFRSAQLLTIDSTGAVATTTSPSQFDDGSGTLFEPNAAWRLVAIPEAHTVYMLHQRGTTGTIDTTAPGGYGSGDTCFGSILQSTITPFHTGTDVTAGPTLQNATLAVDVAYSPVSDTFAVVSPGNTFVPGASTLLFMARRGAGSLTTEANVNDSNCDGFQPPNGIPPTLEPTAVAFVDDKVVVQSREPAALYFPDTDETISLSNVSRRDTGHDVFHSNAGGGLACASCHLEGGEDGRVWTFSGSGPRRTQSIRGGILGTEPFHWDGDQHDFSHLMGEVFVKRMSGPTLDPDQLASMSRWVDHIPYLVQSAPTDLPAIARGKALFEDSENVGCTSCHAGPKMTNNSTLSVGTGAAFQVPSLLGVGWRAPYLHDGVATTLDDRFVSSIGGGDSHGHTSQLSSDQISDLVAYLNSI